LSILSSKSKESIRWTLATGPLLQVAQFGISIILARLLEPRDFGIMGIASIVIFYSNTASDLGFGDAIVRIKKITNEHIDSFFALNLSISMALAIAVILSANALASYFRIPELTNVLRVLSAIFIITSFYNIPKALLRRKLAYKTISQIDILRRIAGFSCTLPLAFLGFRYWALILGTLSANTMATLAILYKSDWRPRFKFYPKAIKEIAGFASWRFISIQASMLCTYIDKLIVGKVLGATPLGFYEKSFGIAFMPVQQIAQRISFVMFSAFSRIDSKSVDMLHYFRRTITLISVLCFPLLIGLYLVADHFVIVMLGEKWAPMIPSLKILIIGFIFASLASPFETINFSSGNYKLQVKIRLIMLAILAVALIYLARFGLSYAAVVVTISNLFFLCTSAFLARSIVNFSLPNIFKVLLPSILGISLMSITIIFMKFFCRDLTFLNLIILVFSGIIVYSAFILFAKFNNIYFLQKEFRAKIKSLFNLLS